MPSVPTLSVCCSVVVSPHVYPPTITTATSAYTGPAFWTRLSYSFGQFNTVRHWVFDTHAAGRVDSTSLHASLGSQNIDASANQLTCATWCSA